MATKKVFLEATSGTRNFPRAAQDITHERTSVAVAPFPSHVRLLGRGQANGRENHSMFLGAAQAYSWTDHRRGHPVPEPRSAIGTGSKRADVIALVYACRDCAYSIKNPLFERT